MIINQGIWHEVYALSLKQRDKEEKYAHKREIGKEEKFDKMKKRAKTSDAMTLAHQLCNVSKQRFLLRIDWVLQVTQNKSYSRSSKNFWLQNKVLYTGTQFNFRLSLRNKASLIHHVGEATREEVRLSLNLNCSRLKRKQKA